MPTPCIGKWKLSRLIYNRKDAEIPGMKVQVNEITLSHPSKLDTVRKHTTKDDDLFMLRDMILSGWPPNRSDIPAALLPYLQYKD